MIYALRQQHRRFVIALSLFLPVTFVVGISTRRTVPADSNLSQRLAPAPIAFKSIIWEQHGLFLRSPVTVQLLQTSSASGSAALELSAPANFIKPDLIVYWVPDSVKLSDTVPNQALLLGAFSSAIFPLLKQTQGSAGRLLLYSLADGEIVDVSQPIQLALATN